MGRNWRDFGENEGFKRPVGGNPEAGGALKTHAWVCKCYFWVALGEGVAHHGTMKGKWLALMMVVGAGQLAGREAWTMSRVQGSPEAPKAYVAEQVFAEIPVDNVVEMVAAGGRFYLLTRDGKLWSFPIREDAGNPELVLNLKALHPEHDSAYSVAFTRSGGRTGRCMCATRMRRGWRTGRSWRGFG
jgi:hypothetical protein